MSAESIASLANSRQAHRLPSRDHPSDGRQRPPLAAARRHRKATLVALGLQALARGDWATVQRLTRLIQRGGLAHV